MVSKTSRCHVWVKKTIEIFLKLAETSPDSLLSSVLVLEKVWGRSWVGPGVIAKKKKVGIFLVLEITTYTT